MYTESVREEIKRGLNRNPQYCEMLFRRGYLFTSKKIEGLNEFPFYSNWSTEKIGRYFLYVHKEQTYYQLEQNGRQVVIIGHAYNPFNKKYKEEELCEELLEAYSVNLESYFDKISEFTGLHVIVLIDHQKVFVCQDACSLTGCYFGIIDGSMYISEQSQLIADLCDLKMDDKVRKLVESKCYNIGNRHLPGNLSPYKKVRRLGANTYLLFDGRFSVRRFFPSRPHNEATSEEEIQNTINRIGDLLHNGIECCTKKWNRCAISLSGGTDSKTTLACAKGLYDKFSYFSFYSKPQELVDATAAAEICDKLGLKHTLYPIPQENSSFENFELVKNILKHNTSYFKNLADNEIRKYLYLHDISAYDIELKSWASEVPRVFLERKYQLKMPKTLTERHCSIFQTRFFMHPFLLKWSDETYYRFLRSIGLEKPLFNYEHSDLFYWEIRMGCWGVSVISSQQLYHRMTIPMNNRKILDLFLTIPRELRIDDTAHKLIMKYYNPDVVDADVEVKNLYFHGYRIWMEKLYYLYRTALYIPKREKEGP